MTITFRVLTVPIPQPRQRHKVVTAHGKTFAQNFTPAKDKVQAYKQLIACHAKMAMEGPPLTGPLGLAPGMT